MMQKKINLLFRIRERNSERVLTKNPPELELHGTLI